MKNNPHTENAKIPIYFMPGMGANSKIFERIHFDENKYSFHFLEWLEPFKKEPLVEYCKRLIENIHHKNPVLIGVSFGGVIVQEIAKLIAVRRVVIISSVKDVSEFPLRMIWARRFKLYHIFPTKYVNQLEDFTKKIVSSKKIKHRIEMYKAYLTMRSSNYLNWAFKQMIEWKNEDPVNNIIHIHGDKDHIFPSKYIKNALILKNATHVLVLMHAPWLNQNLPELLKENKNENDLD